MNIFQFKTINTKKTGEKIKELRKKNGYTVEQICNIFYISPQAVYKWQTGESLPTLDNICILADIFGVSIEDIVVREDTVSSVFLYKLTVDVNLPLYAIA